MSTNLAKEILRALGEQQKKGTRAIDTQAQVRRVEGNTLWVHVPGGVDETPIRKTISAKEGKLAKLRYVTILVLVNVEDGANVGIPPADVLERVTIGAKQVLLGRCGKG